MNERIKKIRKALDLTQQKFADQLGVKRNTVGQWECGINAVTDQVINSICREFNVNETWLRTGEGEMFIELSRDEQIAEFVGRTLSTESESFKKRFIAMLAKLDESDWETLEKIALELAQKKD
ncbi:MAG: helix-turn-helix transcriptional regulator [Dorea sp.]